MNRRTALSLLGGAVLTARSGAAEYAPWVWPGEAPADCPFPQSNDIAGVALTHRYSDYAGFADTWYPSWASDGRLYSPYTDGSCPRLDGGWDKSISWHGKDAVTGQAVMEGGDPLNLKIYSLGLTAGSALPYGGRYPCGSLVHDGVWYYGTYTLGPKGATNYGGFVYNWPWQGPVVGFRISHDYGRTWKDAPHTPEKPLFGETGMWGHPVKIGAPHFVDFGKNMEHSPDGYAYLVAHGAVEPDPKPRFANLSWISADQVYLIRVKPSVETINDASAYEFFAGHEGGKPVWSSDFGRTQPLLEWNNNMGCVTVTYNAPLRKYLMCVTDGWPTCARMNSYVLEADRITGPWRMVAYWKEFGEQAYFLNFPTKFISSNGKTLWLCYSGNFAKDWNREKIKSDPPGSQYGLVLQEVKLLDKRELADYGRNPRPAVE